MDQSDVQLLMELEKAVRWLREGIECITKITAKRSTDTESFINGYCTGLMLRVGNIGEDKCHQE